MIVKNEGTHVVRMSMHGEVTEIKPGQTCELADSVYKTYKEIFPGLKAKEEKVLIHSDAVAIKEVKTHGSKNKKSRK